MATSLPGRSEYERSFIKFIVVPLRPPKLDELILAISIAVEDILSYINGNPCINQ
jgi:hypothetical protein